MQWPHNTPIQLVDHQIHANRAMPGDMREICRLRALLATLRELKLRGAGTLLIHCDNSVVVEQVGGAAAKPIARLASLFDEARALLNSFDQANLVWIPRHRNSEADALARAALGMAEKRVVKIARKRR